VKIGGTEAVYLEDVGFDYISWLLKNLNQLNDYYTNYSGWKTQKTIDTYKMHDNSGFVSMHTLLFGDKEEKKYFKDHVLYNYKEAA
jgi:uncharacterized protein CbrC (UPF0167 family)